MNGHENDANGANSSADNGAANGGIFSTPDLTIETQNIPTNVGGAPVIDETATPADSNSSRIASAFANTDATAQSQDVALAMQNRSNSTSSTATGDIKLAPSAKPKSKAPLIIVALLVLVGVGALVWAAATGKLGFGGGTVMRPIDSYYNLLVYGNEKPTEEEKSEYDGDWFLFTLSETSLGETDTQRYKDLLLEKLNAYAAENANSSSLEQYLQNIHIAANLFTYREIGRVLLKTYIDQGQEPSLEYIKGVTNYKSEDQRIEIANKTLADYLYNQLELFPIYQQMGCIDDKSIDRSCISEHYNEYYELHEDVFDTEEMLLTAIDYWQSGIKSIITKQTNEILGTGKNESND